MIISTFYGLYKSSNETNKKKDELTNKLESLNDDLIMIKENLRKETLKIRNTLENMKLILENHNKLLKNDELNQKEEKYKNHKLIVGFYHQFEEQTKAIINEKKTFEECLSTISLKNYKVYTQ